MGSVPDDYTQTYKGRGKTMEITEVRVRKVTEKGDMKAVVSVTIDGVFVVHDIKIINGENGLFIAMPSRKSASGTYRDIAHPINSDTRKMLETVIIKKYQEELEAEVV